MLEHVYLIPLLPLAASLIILLGFKEDKHSPAPYLGIAVMVWCFIQSCAIFYGVVSGGITLPYEHNIEWFKIGADVAGNAFAYSMPIGVLIDGPASVMLVVVTLVSSLVQIYSLSYMHDDPRYRRYYAYLSFFTASMLGLVVSSNLFITFCCWELVGVSSYLLIGFWFEKPGPAYANKKAFMTTKLGDCGFYVALLLIFAKVGSFQFTQLHLATQQGILAGAAATAVGLGLLFGAVGKSAQWPLFIWLPDAMEGPTPVSALIHAATMVAAGIYLVAKCYFIYLAAPVAMEVVAWVGLVTALLTATMALVAYDIKRVLAFSTVSQLGFMMCALGAGGYTAGLFHLTTHAFFKALLFLGAGSVIHAVHTNDMREMGALSKKMPITFVTMGLATLAIAGVPPFAGYFSKEMILGAVYEHNPTMFFLLAFAALLTAFYMTRMMVLTFLGDARDHEKHHHAHESPAPMTGPLILLAVLSVVSGWAFAHDGFIGKLLPPPSIEASASPEAAAQAEKAEEKPAISPTALGAMGATGAPAAEAAKHEGAVSEGKSAEPKKEEFPEALGYGVTACALLSIAFAFMLYRGPTYPFADAVKSRFSVVFNVLERRYGFDALFLWFVDIADAIARFCFWVDANVVDKIFVDGWGLLMQILAHLSEFFDQLFIDKTVDGFGGLSWDLGVGLRSLVRAGQVQEYLMYIAVVVSLFATLILTR